MISSIESNFKPVLEECLATDSVLVEKFHINSTGKLADCVEKTFKDLSECKEMYFYKVLNNNHLAGYYCIEKFEDKTLLCGFFLKPEFRNEKKSFLNLIKDSTNNKPFICGLYKKNIRANKFLIKNGAKMILDNEDSTVYLMGVEKWL